MLNWLDLLCIYYGVDGVKLLLIRVTCIGQPLLNLEKSVHFSTLESLSITSHLYVVTKRWRKTNIIALAMFNPMHVLPPIPKAKKLYGFASSSNLEGMKLLGSSYTCGSKCIDLASTLTFQPFLIS
nr:hypothetical protein Iba_chr14cCG16320 [Ipomoea batatas]